MLDTVHLGNIALFLSLGLFPFSIENAEYLEGVGEVKNLKKHQLNTSNREVGVILLLPLELPNQGLN